MKSIIAVSLILLISFLTIGCGGSSGNGNNDANATLKTNVFGTVLDANGNAVEGATVTISSNPVIVITESDGEFSAAVEIGEHEIKIEKDSAVIWSRNFSIVENQAYILSEIITTYNEL